MSKQQVFTAALWGRIVLAKDASGRNAKTYMSHTQADTAARKIGNARAFRPPCWTSYAVEILPEAQS
jgi:hypothetical protein